MYLELNNGFIIEIYQEMRFMYLQKTDSCVLVGFYVFRWV